MAGPAEKIAMDFTDGSMGLSPPRPIGVIVLGQDPLAVDYVAVPGVGLDPDPVPTLARAWLDRPLARGHLDPAAQLPLRFPPHHLHPPERTALAPLPAPLHALALVASVIAGWRGREFMGLKKNHLPNRRQLC